MKRDVELLHFIFWVSSNFLCTLGQGLGPGPVGSAGGPGQVGPGLNGSAGATGTGYRPRPGQKGPGATGTLYRPRPGQKGPGQRPQDHDLWCLFCRSDKNPSCINKAVDNAESLTQACTNEAVNEFITDLKIDKPDRPIVGPRAADIQLRWACYRMYTVDQTFTLRTCLNTNILKGIEEECHKCSFHDKPAKCCTCPTSNCNYKNSNATRIMFNGKPVFIIFNVLLCIKSLFH